MTARVGVTKDARLLSGADIGRMITLPGGGQGTIHGIEHAGGVVTILLHPHHVHAAVLDAQSPVTITGADNPNQ